MSAHQEELTQGPNDSEASQSTGAAETTPQIHGAKKQGLQNSVLGTRNLMTVAAVAVIGSLIVAPLQYLSIAVAVDIRGAFIIATVMGLWVIPYLLPAVVVPKPGAIVIASLTIGIVISFTTPVGIAGVPGSLWGGILAGLPLVAFLYRRWAWWVYLLCATSFSVINAAMIPFAYPGMSFSAIQRLLVVGLAVVSGLMGAAACLGLKKALVRTGVA